MGSKLRHPLAPLGVAVALTIPWLWFWGTNAVHSLSTLWTVTVSGVGVLGASFLLAWGAETAEKDVPRAFALAVLAVLAVAPEYAVDALYAWQAGIDPGNSQAANLAVANMTGANRILIGLGWAGIALFSIHIAHSGSVSGGEADVDPDSGEESLSDAEDAGKSGVGVDDRPGALRDAVELDPSISTEIVFLAAATVYAFAVPLGGGIDWYDMVVLVGLYVAYIAVILRGDVDEGEEHVGVPAYLQELSKGPRIATVLALFAFSGFMIFTAVEPFAHGLETLGLKYNVPEFFMIQWFAPLASESPELIITAYLVQKARATAAFNALISSKLNQWTLLIGTLVVVYSIALGRYGALPFDAKQAAEIWLTAAQSFFALAVLVNFRISVGEAVTLLVLFVSQVAAEFALIRTLPEAAAGRYSYWLLIGFSVVYLVLGSALFLKRTDSVREVIGRARRQAKGGNAGADPSPGD